MPPVLIVSGEALGSCPAGPALRRAAGLARALARRGHDVVVAAPGPSEAPEGCELAPLDALATLAPGCRCAVVSGFLLARHPVLRRAPALCADLAGPFLIENLWVRRSLPPGRRRIALADEADVVAGLLQEADLILCAGERQRDLLLGMLLARAALRPELLDADPALRELVAVLPFGVPDGEPPARPQRPPGPLRLLWPGGLWDWLDAATLLDGLAGARRAGADVELELWGTRSPDPAVPAMAAGREAVQRAAALGIADAVHVEPWVPYAERAERLVAADVAVTLDPAGLEARFAFRTRLLDALWAGVPTLATAGEQVADEAAAAGAGWVALSPADAGTLAERLGALAGSRPQLEAAARRTALVVDRYRYDQLVEPLHRFCADPVRRRPGALRRRPRQQAGKVLGNLRQRAR